MKNPFIAMTIMAATMMAAVRENQMRDFFGKGYQPSVGGSHRGHPGSKRPPHITKSENRRRDKAAKQARRLQRI